MPELPEAERARQQIERALGREIVAVDDRDTYVCRPHAPGEIAAALIGHRLTAAHRRGKFLWAETDGGGRTSGCTSGWPGRIVVDEPPPTAGTASRSSSPTAAGSRCATSAGSAARVIEPDFSHVGPDAAEVSRDVFRARVGRGTIADQGAAARPGDDRRRRQPARRRDALARAAVPAARRRRADRGRARPPAPRAARRDARRDPQGRRAHRRLHPAPQARRSVPALRHGGRARDHRRPHDVLVPDLPAGVKLRR